MDGESFFVFLIFALFISGFAAIVFWANKVERKRQDALEALAKDRGWHLENQRGNGRKAPSQFQLTPAQPGPDWRLRVIRRRSGSKGKTGGTSNPGKTEFLAPSPALQGGLAVFMPEMGAALTGTAGAMMGMFDNAIGRRLLSAAVGPEFAQHIGSLQAFDAPAQARLSVMATADPALWFDMEAIGHAIHSWNPPSGSNRAPPRVMIGSDGLSVILNYEVTDPALIAQFVALGQGIAENAALRR